MYRSEIDHTNHYDLQDMPDEVLLNIVKFLDIETLLKCSHTCQRIRYICHDESLWRKINLFGKKVPAQFVEFIFQG